MLHHKTYFNFLVLLACIESSLVFSYFLFFNNLKPQTLWHYQCIDTMKVSRDRARSWKTVAYFDREISHEMEVIKKLGANCVAIDTPYDEEFVPFLKMWVQQARKENLHIWFRGNFSSWEGWFSYPKGMTTQEHLQKTREFIVSHKELFANDDIFTPSPEAENGWLNGYVPSSEYPLFRQFLIDEHHTAQEAFAKIGKNIQTNWLSMNGQLAKDMLDENTVHALGNTIAIDHYVKDRSVMKNYIDNLYQRFHAHIIIGEFGAPIPDINGSMSDQEQADFVSSIYTTLFQEHDVVYGVNYWTLNEGTTALLDKNGADKPVANIIKNFYQPTIITGTITNELGDPIDNATILANDDHYMITTNPQGQYLITIPENPLHITVAKEGYATQQQSMVLNKNKSIIQNVQLVPMHPSLFYQIRYRIKNVINNASFFVLN